MLNFFFCLEIEIIYFFFLQKLNFFFNFFFLQKLNFFFNFFFLQKLNFFKLNSFFIKFDKILCNSCKINYFYFFKKNINKYVMSFFFNFIFSKFSFKSFFFLNNVSLFFFYKYFFNIIYQFIKNGLYIYIFDLNFKNMYYLYSYMYNKNFIKMYQNFFFFNINKIFRKNFYFFFKNFFRNNNVSLIIFLDYKFSLKNIVEFSKFNIPLLNFSSYFYDFKYIDISMFGFNVNYVLLFNWFLLNKFFFISINDLILINKIYFYKCFNKYLTLI